MKTNLIILVLVLWAGVAFGWESAGTICIDGHVFLKYEYTSMGNRSQSAGIGLSQFMIWDEEKKATVPKTCKEK